MSPKPGHIVSQATREKIRQSLLGRKRPPEVVLKMSLSRKGKKPSLETRMKLRAAHLGAKNHFFGKTHTPEVREKLRLVHLGKPNPHSIEMRRKLSEAHKRRHTGISLRHPDKSIRRSFEYKLWREAVFARDDYRCYDCGERGGDLQAHHIFPFATFPRLRFVVENGLTLCLPCHKKYSKGPKVLRPAELIAA